MKLLNQPLLTVSKWHQLHYSLLDNNGVLIPPKLINEAVDMLFSLVIDKLSPEHKVIVLFRIK